MIHHLTLGLKTETPRLYLGYDNILNGFELIYRDRGSPYRNNVALSDGSLFNVSYQRQRKEWEFVRVIAGSCRAEQIYPHHWMLQGLITWMLVRNQVHILGRENT